MEPARLTRSARRSLRHPAPGEPGPMLQSPRGSCLSAPDEDEGRSRCLLGNSGNSPGPKAISDRGCSPSACLLVTHYQPLAIAAVEHVQQVVDLALGHQPAQEPYR